jgi:CheY-like chemotaxis protein
VTANKTEGLKENAILLVEDCSEDASLVQMAFKRWGIANPIMVVPDGEHAVDYLSGNGKYADREQFPLPCLALLDLNLPQMSGFDVLEWLRSRHQFADLHVVVLSGTKDPTHFDKAHALGANACVVKTNDLAALQELIQHLNYFSLASDYNNSAVEWFPET